MSEFKNYIIETKEVTDETFIESFGGKIIYNYVNLPTKASIWLPIDQEELLKNSNGVIRLTEPTLGGGGALRDYANSTYYGYKTSKTYLYADTGYIGAGVKVAILDTGIANHSALPEPVLWKDFIVNNSYRYDDHGHGTFVAGAISANGPYKGNAYGVSLYVGKVLDSNNRGTASNFIAGIDWAISQGVDIINISITMDAYDQDVVDACHRAYTSGIIVVACSGNGTLNDGIAVGTVACPASSEYVIGVGSINKSLQRASFSNYGTGLDLVAPGENLVSTYVDADKKIITNAESSLYMQWSGTSFSTAMVSAHFACLKQKYPSFNRSQLVNALLDATQTMNNTNEYGRGVLVAQRVILETPTLSFVSSTNSIINISASYVANTYRYDAIIYDSSNVVVGSTQSFTTDLNTQYITLQLNTDYYFKIQASPNGDWDDYLSSPLSVLYGPWRLGQRPPNFAWTYSKNAGQPFYVTAIEWNSLIGNITNVYSWKSWDISSYPMSSASTNNNFTATIFNQVKNAIGSKNATDISDKISGNPILASDLNTLVTKLNGIT